MRAVAPARLTGSWPRSIPLAERYLAGHRLEARPSAGLDVGLAELARFDGAASAPLYLLPLMPYSHLEKRAGLLTAVTEDSVRDARAKNNVMWTADLTWRVAPGARVWGELVVDDISFASTWRPRSIGWQAGAHARRRLGAGAVAARAEYTRVHRFTYSVWHHHDFAFAGLPLGYALGPDVERLEARLSWEPGADWALAAEGATPARARRASATPRPLGGGRSTTSRSRAWWSGPARPPWRCAGRRAPRSRPS